MVNAKDIRSRINQCNLKISDAVNEKKKVYEELAEFFRNQICSVIESKYGVDTKVKVERDFDAYTDFDVKVYVIDYSKELSANQEIELAVGITEYIESIHGCFPTFV